MFTTKNLLILIVKNISIALLVVIVSATSIFFINKKIETTTDSVVLKHKLENELKKRTEMFSVIDKNAQFIGNNDKLIDKAFIPSNNISEFMNALDNIYPDKMTPQVYRFETPAPSPLSGEIALSDISYTNNLNMNIRNFSLYLNSFEKLPYFTKIDGINISSQSKSGLTDTSSIIMKATLLTKTVQ